MLSSLPCKVASTENKVTVYLSTDSFSLQKLNPVPVKPGFLTVKGTYIFEIRWTQRYFFVKKFPFFADKKR